MLSFASRLSKNPNRRACLDFAGIAFVAAAIVFRGTAPRNVKSNCSDKVRHFPGTQAIAPFRANEVWFLVRVADFNREPPGVQFFIPMLAYEDLCAFHFITFQ